MYSVASNEMPGMYSYTTGETVSVVEMLAPGCFDDAIKNSADVTCNINHDDDRLLGRTSSGTLKLTLDNVGLAFECTFPAGISYAEDLKILMQRGDMNQCSFAFTLDPANIVTSTVNGQCVETITKVEELYDVSVVTRGQYPQPFSTYRNLEELVTKLSSEKNPQTVENRTIETEVNEPKDEAHERKSFKKARMLALLDLQYKLAEV